MSHPVKIKNALISVYYKDNLEPIIHQLNRLGVNIYSTGGTEKFITDLGVAVIPVEDLTSYPSILGGRVKTLHPKVFGGILGRRELAEDVAQMEAYNIPEIDLNKELERFDDFYNNLLKINNFHILQYILPLKAIH